MKECKKNITWGLGLRIRNERMEKKVDSIVMGNQLDNR